MPCVAQIEKAHHVPPQQVNLFFKGNSLDSGKKLEEYDLKDEDCVEWERSRKRKRKAGESVLAKLQRRECSAEGQRFFDCSSAEEKFHRLKQQMVHDVYDPEHMDGLHARRQKIVEIVAAKDLIFVLTQNGITFGYDRRSSQKKHCCCLNRRVGDEMIRSLFYNKSNDSLITVSVYREDNFSSLNCRSTSIADIEAGEPHKGEAIFVSESLKWPGFVEFDDVNAKVLTYSATSHAYKIWDLKNYTQLYAISDTNVQEIKISPGIMLLIFEREGRNVPLRIISIEDGTVLTECTHVLKTDGAVDFIEQFNEKLLVKQKNENLLILNVQNGDSMEVESTEFVTPAAFIFLYENQLFLPFKSRSVAVWNFRGELITRFEDHNLWYPDCNTNNIYITSQQDLIVSYCKQANRDDSGTINISNILTGKCLCKIDIAAGSNFRPDKSDDVTSLFYNEERNEIYSGSRSGKLTVWSN
jgi:hypothetical protein